MLEFVLPWPPTVNSIWKHNNRGTVRLSKEAQAYHWQVKIATMGKPKLNGKLSIKIRSHAPDERVRDLDNLLKVPLDALQKAGIYENDNQIDEIHIVRGHVIKNEGCLSICLTERENIT